MNFIKKEFDYIDIYQKSTKFPLGEASIKGPISIGFRFPFFGMFYKELFVSSEGFLTFLPNSAFGSVPGKYLKLLIGLWQNYAKGG